MICPLCGYQFSEAEGLVACQGCLMAAGCHMIKCPNCGYDIPEEPGLIKALKTWRKGKNGATGTS